VHFTFANREIDASEDLVPGDGNSKAFDLEQDFSLSQRFPPS